MTFETAGRDEPKAPRGGDLDIAFHWVVKHILIEATFGKASASFATKAGLQPAPATGREFRGLDGRTLESRPVLVKGLRLGDSPAGDAVFYATDLTVIASMGLPDNSGLLGNDFLLRFRVLEVDFAGHRVRLTGSLLPAPIMTLS